MDENLFWAICNEHKQRTGHEFQPYNNKNLKPPFCDVCMRLKLYWQENYTEKENEFYLEAYKQTLSRNIECPGE